MKVIVQLKFSPAKNADWSGVTVIRMLEGREGDCDGVDVVGRW